MATILLDTNVASLLHPSKRTNPGRAKVAKRLEGHTLALSFQSVAELLLWAEQRGWGPRARSLLELFIERFLIVPFDMDLARAWAHVMAWSRREGRRLEAADGWIAATALRRGLPLITFDSDLIGLSVPGMDVSSVD